MSVHAQEGGQVDVGVVQDIAGCAALDCTLPIGVQSSRGLWCNENHKLLREAQAATRGASGSGKCRGMVVALPGSLCRQQSAIARAVLYRISG